MKKLPFFHSEFFPSGKHYRNVKTNFFLKKTSLLLVGFVFQASEKQFFPSDRYSWLWKQFFRQVETFFLTNSSFRVVETERVFFYLEICWSFWKSGVVISSSGNCFYGRQNLFSISQIFCLVKTVFFFLFRGSFLQMKTVTEASWNK